jgi:ribosomal protein S4
MDLEERRQVQAEVDELLQSNQIDVATMASSAKKALDARKWQRAKDLVAEAQKLVSVATTLNEVLVNRKICVSFAQCRRLVEGKGVKVNGSKPPRWNMRVKAGDEIQVGKGKAFTL